MSALGEIWRIAVAALPAVLDKLAVMALTASALWLCRIVGYDTFARVSIWARWMKLLVLRPWRQTVYLYVDLEKEDDHLHAFARRIAPPNAKFRVEVLSEPDSLLRWPLSPFLVRAAVLIITDVTPFSANSKARQQLGLRMRDYARAGGTLVLGHDALYRRTKNAILQELAGARTTGYELRKSPIRYAKVVAGSKLPPNRLCKRAVLMDALPDAFDLADGEAVFADMWKDDVEFLYVHEDRPTAPLVTRRTAGRGAVFWIASGDTSSSGPPGSITDPASKLPEVLRVLVETGTDV